jgi:hypothetical protein
MTTRENKVAPCIYRICHKFLVYAKKDGKTVVSPGFDLLEDAQEWHAIHKGKRSQLAINKKSAGATGYKCVHILVKDVLRRVRNRAQERAHKRAVHAQNPEIFCNRKSAQYREDPLPAKMRAAVRKALTANGGRKCTKTEASIMCSIKDLRAHLLNQDPAYSDKGHDVDHIFPINLYVAKGNTESANHYTNLQPLTDFENGSKKHKLPTKAMAAKVDLRFWPNGITMDMLPDIYPGWRTPLRM